MTYLYLKSLHIIFVITWFCGLFYSVRLLIYHREAQDLPKAEQEILIKQYRIMEKRLWYGITWPSAILTLIFGFSILHDWFPLTQNPWLVAKLFCVFLLFLYHLKTGSMIKKAKTMTLPKTSTQLRIWNELPTLLLFTIVFLVVLKSSFDALYGVIILILLSILLMAGIKIYRRVREGR